VGSIFLDFLRLVNVNIYIEILSMDKINPRPKFTI
jgi:hypothetical protein